MSIKDESCSKKMVWKRKVSVGGNWTRYLNACGARAVAQLQCMMYLYPTMYVTREGAAQTRKQAAPHLGFFG